MNPLDPEARCPEEMLSCYLIINGPLGMSAGKLCAQAAQALERLQSAYERGEGTEIERERYQAWRTGGTRTITRIAETENAFSRACRELPGVTMIDEGLTEIKPDSPTIHISWPLPRKPTHPMCQHKRIPLLEGPPIRDRYGGREKSEDRSRELVAS